MAELAFAGLERPCLTRRLALVERLAAEVAAWEAPRTAAGTTVTWRVTTPTARARLARHSPGQAA
jgi:hypothetical protein